MQGLSVRVIPSRKSLLAFCALLAVGITTVVFAMPSGAATPGVKIFVGYADNDRPNAVNFPAPWEGDPSVVFQGCHPTQQCLYDSGAVRVENDNTTAVTVDSIKVNFGPTCTYDIWPHGTSLPAGSNLIVTQLVTGEGNGCTPQSGQMDGSDIGPNGANWAGHCDNSGIVPSVDVSINGSSTHADDSGQVLNTGGTDKGTYCPNRQNESSQWTLIGKPSCDQAVLTLAPPTQTKTVGSPATVIATLTNNCGTPLEGVGVDFKVLTGPNAGKTGTGTTNVSGQATFTYTSTTTGTDTVEASVTNPAVGTFASNDVTVIWVAPANPIRLTGRAYGLANFGSLLKIAPTPDTGSVSTTSNSVVAPKCVLSIPGPISASVLCASVTTRATPSPAGSFAQAYVASVTIAIPGVPTIIARAVQADSTSKCSGATGSTALAFLSVGGNTVVNTADFFPPPNFKVEVPGVVKIVLNEQLPVPGASQGLTVNAIHITVLNTVLDIVISSARSDIHNCPAAG